MKITLIGVILLWVVMLGLAAQASSTGSEVGVKVSDKTKAEDKTSLEDTPKEVKAEEMKKPSKPDSDLKKSKGSAKEDRPWIIKEHTTKKSHTPKKNPFPVKWENDEQRLQCETLLRKLQKTLGKARTYSIRGDTCATARHADGFLNLEKRLRNECPERYLENNGYSEKIIQNVKVLWELGKKACLDK